MQTLVSLLLLCIAIPALSAADSNDQPLARNPDASNGAHLFAACAACHGADAGGKEDGSVPAIAGQHWQVLTKLLLDFRYYRRWDSRMVNRSASDHLRGPQEIADVVAYVSGLPPPRTRGLGTGEHVPLGSAAYARWCSMCHGPQAQGDGPGVIPQLAGQHFAYLLRQMRNGVDGTRPTFNPAHIRLVRNLSKAQIDGIADYLARLDSSRVTAMSTSPQ
jgi:cytochrome c553